MKSNYRIDVSDKFKTNYIQVRYLVEANKENTTKTALLSMYLVYCNNYDRTYKEANDRLDALYGSKFDISVNLSGNHLVFNFILSFVATKYVKHDTEYLNNIMTTYLNYIFDPLMDDDVFSNEAFELKKYELNERIKAAYDDKTTYALEEFLSVFAKGYPLALNSNGYIEDVNKMDAKSLTDFYQQLIKQTPLVSGNVSNDDIKKVEDILKSKIKEESYDKSFEWYCIDNDIVEETIEKQEITQSKLVVGYAFNKKLDYKDYYTGLVLNAILGMSSNSYLFRIVREQENLCYTIRSTYDLYSNSIIIYAGIEKENYDLAVSLIDGIIEDMKSNKINEEDFNDAKTVMIDVVNKVNDGQSGLVNYKANRLLQGYKTTLEEDIININKVSINDIVDLIKELEFKTKYLLSGEINE